jgi:plasmid stabilization system protein ParE
MARIVVAPEVQSDFDRIFDFLSVHNVEGAAKHIDDIVRALDILQTSPQIGRPVGGAGAMRELVISHGAHGYLALYRYVAELDIVLVAAVRSQRELRYRRTDN